jgi:fumarylacetoacetate (FAA) hydrolase family protein
MKPEEFLPIDGYDGTLLCRVWNPGRADAALAGPSPAVIREDGVFDLGHLHPTMADLLEAADPGLLRDRSTGARLGSVAELVDNSLDAVRRPDRLRLLAPVDLQAVKACGVTFAHSLIERVIEEKAGGDPARAGRIRATLADRFGTALTDVRPGSEDAGRLKTLLVEQGMWSQYLEVGIGPYAEVFTKCQALSAVGFGEDVGVNAISEWNNPEPEVVLLVNAAGVIVGATLGNDVNLRDIEGRSALLLGKAKDNNASCAIGPFIRLLDETFTLQHLREQEVELRISGDDGYRLQDRSSMAEISRDVCELVTQTINESHQYPDGLALFTGTLFTPSEDRDEPGKGFTHHLGDRVSIRSSHLGCLENRVTHSHLAPPWTFGLSSLMGNLHRRGLLR